MTEALVFAIEEFSVFDGPGIRTSVFLSGCPLRCEWCHNPEGQSFENTVLRSPNGCLRCHACEANAVQTESGIRYTDQSIAACPRGLLRYAATRYTPHTLLERLQNLLPMLNAGGGGVTFSGGEPLSSPTFLLEALDLLAGKTHRAVQSCGYAPKDTFSKTLSRCDYMLFDIKIVNDDLHKQYTGVSNISILANFKALAKSGLPFVVRTPLIPGVTDTEKNLCAIAALLASEGVASIELLPYNKAAGSKYPLAGRIFAPHFDQTVPVTPHTEIFAEHGIRAKII